MRDGRSRSPLCDGGGQGGGLGNSAAAGGRRRVGPRWLCVLVALVACLGAADAVHFQSGTVDFEVMEGTERTVVFTLRTMWLRSYSAGSVFEGSGGDERAIVGDIVDLTGTEPVQLDAGDGSPPYSLKLIVQKASPEEDWIYGTSTVIHTYPPSSCVGRFCPAAAFTAVLQGCCRRSVHGASFSVSTRVTFAGHVSVASAGLPVQTVYAHSGVIKLEMPAYTPTGESPSYWRLGNGRAETGGAPDLNGAVYFDGSDNQLGLLSVDTDAMQPGTVPVVVVMSGAGGEYISLDLELRVLPGNLTSPSPEITGSAWTQSAGTMSGVVEIYAGFEAIVSLAATPSVTFDENMNVSAGAMITSLRTFGMPRGAQLTPPRSSNVSLAPQGVGAAAGINSNATNLTDFNVVSVSSDFRWTAGLEEIGGMFPVCFEAVDELGLSSGQRCFTLLVREDPGVPSFVAPNTGQVSVAMQVMGTGNISMQVASPNPFAKLSVEVDSLTPLEEGMYLSVSHQTEIRRRISDAATRSAASATFMWTPGVNYGGYDRRVCFLAVSRGGTLGGQGSTRLCVDIAVERCRYRVKTGETFQSIARTFGMDSLTLWGLNVDSNCTQPTAGADISLGRLYTVGHGDTLLSISKELGTTVASIRRLNYDLSGHRAATALEYQSVICVFPSTCTE